MREHIYYLNCAICVKPVYHVYMNLNNRELFRYVSDRGSPNNTQMLQFLINCVYDYFKYSILFSVRLPIIYAWHCHFHMQHCQAE